MKTQLPSKIFLILFVVLMFVGFYAITQQAGPSGGVANAPGENNCTNCHNGTLVTSGTNWTNIKLTSNIPASGYVPDFTYTMTLSQTQSGINRFGFQLTALLASNNTKAGTLIVTNNTTTRLRTGTRDYIEQTSSGSAGSGGAISWTFNWRAPSTNVGNIIFYSVVLATNSNGGTSGDMTIAKTFTYSFSSLLPTAIITVADSTVCVGDTVLLSGSGANNPTSWAWTMVNASPASSTVQNPKIIYNTSGTFTVSLITTNSVGASSATTKRIFVSAKPIARITPVGSFNICKGDSVTLSANTGTGLTYLWNTSKTTASIYVKTSGTYYVIVTNSTGCSVKSNQVIVTVYPLPDVGFTYNQSFLQFSFSDTTRNAAFWMWDFGDSKTDSIQKPVHTYISSGIFDVMLTVTDSNNCINDTTKKVNAFTNNIGERVLSLYNVKYIRSLQLVDINYELSSDGNVTINVYDQSGKRINNIQPGLQMQGKYNFTISTTDLNKGIYIISLKNKNSISSKKVIID